MAFGVCRCVDLVSGNLRRWRNRFECERQSGNKMRLDSNAGVEAGQEGWCGRCMVRMYTDGAVANETCAVDTLKS